MGSSKKEFPMSSKLIAFRGSSGKFFAFHAVSPDLNLKDVGAVYALCKRTQDDDGKNLYNIIYLGQTEKLGRAIANHRKEVWMLAHNVNCVCVHLEENGDKRLLKVADLGKHYGPLITPPMAEARASTQPSNNHP